MCIRDRLNAVLEAGTYAPTGMGTQSPLMVVVPVSYTHLDVYKRQSCMYAPTILPATKVSFAPA